MTSKRGSETPVSALLLSGGASKRFGPNPKALMVVHGEPALARMARIASDEALAPVAIVVPPDSAEVTRLARTLAPVVVRSERSMLGRTASVQEGLRALPQGQDLLLWPVDHAFVSARSVHALRRAHSRDPLGRWFIPRWQGRGGHPVLIGHEVFPRILSLGADEPLRRLLPELGPQVVGVATDDAAVAEPVETQEGYRAARQRPTDPREATWTEP